MGPDFPKLHPSVARFHSFGPGALAEGSLRVRRGTNLVANLIGWLGGVPPASETGIPVRLEIQPGRRGEQGLQGEHWRRRFGERPFESQMWERDGLLMEAIGPTVFGFRLLSEDGCLRFETERCHFLILPIPRFMWPRIRVVASPSPTDPESQQQFGIFVDFHLPCIGRIVEYSGEMLHLNETCNQTPQAQG